jgi:PAS domain S-box-containing protein
MFEITGYTMEEINRLGWYQTLYPDPEVQARARARMDRMRDGDNLRAEEWTIVRAGGARRIVSISTSVVLKEGDAVHVLALLQDVTGQKEARR